MLEVLQNAAGTVVHCLARWRVVTIPVTVGLAILGVAGFTRVESEFTFSDFFAEDSDFIQSLGLLETHFGGTSGGGTGLVCIEGDLTQLAALASPATTAAAGIEVADGDGFVAYPTV